MRSLQIKISTVKKLYIQQQQNIYGTISLLFVSTYKHESLDEK